jgi:hypothetical protein
MQIINVVGLQVHVESNLPVGSEFPSVMANDFMILIANPGKMGGDIGEGGYRVGIGRESHGNQSRNFSNGERLKRQGGSFNVIKGVSLRLADKLTIEGKGPGVIGAR